jgi:hypothetical protein
MQEHETLPAWSLIPRRQSRGPGQSMRIARRSALPPAMRRAAQSRLKRTFGLVVHEGGNQSDRSDRAEFKVADKHNLLPLLSR